MCIRKYVDSSLYKLLGAQTFLKAFAYNSLFPLPHYWYRIGESSVSLGPSVIDMRFNKYDNLNVHLHAIHIFPRTIR